MKQKPKELDWGWRNSFYKEFGYLETPIDFYTGNTYANPKMKGLDHLDKIADFIDETLTQQRTELLDEQFEKAETESEIASKAYDQGYLDCKKGRKKAPHDTRDGYCCACSYDICIMKNKIKKAYNKGYKKGNETSIKSKM